MKKLKLLAFVSALALVSGVASAQDSGALLDLLVKKKVITDQEAEATRAELAKEIRVRPPREKSISPPRSNKSPSTGTRACAYDYREANASALSPRRRIAPAPISSAIDCASVRMSTSRMTGFSVSVWKLATIPARQM